MKFAAALLIAAAVQAADVAFYPSILCSGASVRCTGLTGAMCCTVNLTGYYGVRLENAIQGYLNACSGATCTGTCTNVLGGAQSPNYCLGATFGQIRSARTTSNTVKRDDASECAGPDTVVYVDEAGVEQRKSIPAELQAQVEAAVLEGDLEVLVALE